MILDRFRPEARRRAIRFGSIRPATVPRFRSNCEPTIPKDCSGFPTSLANPRSASAQHAAESASVFEPGPGDDRKSRKSHKGPVAIARGNMLVIGFNPFAGAMRYELAAPLLVGNILRWAAPMSFAMSMWARKARARCRATRQDFDRKSVQVLDDSGKVLPFNIRDRAVQFFAESASRVRVIAGNSERVYSLTLPEMWDVKWNPPASARHGIPAWNDSIRRSRSFGPGSRCWAAPAAYGVDYSTAVTRPHVSTS